MDTQRRNLAKLLSLGALFPAQAAYSLNNILESIPADSSKQLLQTFGEKGIEKLFKKAVVYDGLVISRNWNEDSFKALAESGYTGFNASLDSGKLEKSLKSIEEWKQIISNNPDKLLLTKSANDIVTAKKEDKVAVMLGFQSLGFLEAPLKN